MAHFDWTRQTVSSGGTGNLTLAAVTGFPTINQVVGTSTTFPYSITTAQGAPLEAGYASLSDSTTMVRDTILETYSESTYDNTTPDALDIPVDAVVHTPILAKSLQDDIDASIAAAIGSSVQAYSANLDSWSSEVPGDYLTTASAASTYQPIDAGLTDIAALAVTDGNIIVGDGSNWVAESGATARASLGVAIGSDVQAYSANLDEYAAVNPTAAGLALIDDADASAQRTTLGLGSLATLSTVNDGNWSGTDLAIANGGTGGSTASAARTNLGLEIGTDVQAYSANLAEYAAVNPTAAGLALLDDANAAAQRTTLSAAARSQTYVMCGVIAAPDDQDYRLFLAVPFGFTITKTKTRSASGTCTATFKINTTALGGTANSVSTTEQNQDHSTSNAGSAGDDVVLTVSSNSSCEFLSFSIEYTRTLA